MRYRLRDGSTLSNATEDVNCGGGGISARRYAMKRLPLKTGRALSQEPVRLQPCGPIVADLNRLYEMVPRILIRPVTAVGALVRHDAATVGDLLAELARDRRVSLTPPSEALAASE
jgi:hypothetical protein